MAIDGSCSMNDLESSEPLGWDGNLPLIVFFRTVSDHPFSRYEVEYDNLDDAIEHCKFWGIYQMI